MWDLLTLRLGLEATQPKKKTATLAEIEAFIKAGNQ